MIVCCRRLIADKFCMFVSIFHWLSCPLFLSSALYFLPLRHDFFEHITGKCGQRNFQIAGYWQKNSPPFSATFTKAGAAPGRSFK